MAIVRGTTPILRFTFTEVDASNITAAFLVIKHDHEKIIEKNISQLVSRTNTTMDWKLSQTETLQLPEGKTVDICCDWKLSDGTRGRSTIISEWVESGGKNEVI